MDKLNETISKLEAWIYDQNAMDTEIDACLVADALELLKEQQPKIIMCKDCRYYDALTESCNDGIDGIMLPEFYCGNAEPKDGDGE